MIRGRQSEASRPIDRWVGFVVRRPLRVLLGSIAATVVIGLGALRLTIDLDPEGLFPPGHPYVRVDREINDQFGGRNLIAIAVLPKAGLLWRHDVLAAVAGVTAELLSRTPGVVPQTVVSLASPYVRVPTEHGGILSAPMLMESAPETAEQIDALKAKLESEPLLSRLLVSRDERAALVFADFYDGIDHAEIVRRVERVIDQHRSPDLEFAVTGLPMFSVTSAAMMDQQGWYFLATMSAIIFVLYAVFRHAPGVVIPCLTALLSTGCALGLMGFLGVPMNSWTAMAPLVIMTVGAGHSAQMLKRYYEQLAELRSHRTAVEASAKAIAPVMIAAGATAGCGFAALPVLGVPSLAQFGIVMASGIFAAVLLEMTFMLALRTLWRGGVVAARQPKSTSRLTGALGTIVLRRPGRVVAAFGLVTLVALAALPALSVEFVDTTYVPRKSEMGRALETFREHFPYTDALMILVEGPPRSLQSPAALHLMAKMQRTMAEDPDVGGTSSLADLVLRSYQALAGKPDATEIPDDAELVAQTIYLSQSPAFERYVDRAFSRAVVIGMLRGGRSAIARRVISRLEATIAANPVPGVTVRLAGGRAGVLVALNDHAIHGKILNIAVVLAAVLTISAWLLRSARGGALVATPLVMALVVNLALFAVLRVAFDFIGASIASIGVGIGADFAIYFLYRWREEILDGASPERAFRTAMDTSGSAIVFVAAAISAGFGVYVVSEYHAFRILGIFIPITMLVAAATALTLLPAAAMLLRPEFLYRSSRAVGGARAPALHLRQDFLADQP